MKTAIGKWGNSLALRLPRKLAQDLNLEEGSSVELRVEGEELVVAPAPKTYRLDELLARFRPEHRHAEVDWGEPRGEEVW